MTPCSDIYASEMKPAVQIRARAFPQPIVKEDCQRGKVLSDFKKPPIRQAGLTGAFVSPSALAGNTALRPWNHSIVSAQTNEASNAK